MATAMGGGITGMVISMAASAEVMAARLAGRIETNWGYNKSLSIF